MNRWIKRSLIALVGIGIFGAAGLSLGAWLGDRKAMRHVDVAVAQVAIPVDAASIEHGRYLLTPGDGSAMARYAGAEQFIAMLRSGRRPDGSEVSSVMPFGSLRELNDAEAKALYAHLKRLAPVAAGNR